MSIPATLADFLYRFRLPLSAAIVIGAAAFAPLAGRTTIDNDLSAWIAEDDPAYQEYERFREEFGGTRNLIVALQSPNVFTPEVLGYVDRVSRDLEKVNRVDRVYSLATANIVRPLPATADDDGGVEITPLLENRLSTSEGALAVRADALDDPLIRGDLVSADATVTAIVVTFDEDQIDAVRAAVLDNVRHIIERDMPYGLTAYYNGSLEISESYTRVTVANATELTPPVMVMTLAGLYWMFRSVRRTLLIALAVSASLLWTLGLYFALGFTVNVLTSMLAPLVIVLAIADDVHLVQHFDHVLRATGNKEQAFKSSITRLFAPLLGASGTTALGMLSLATSDVVAVRTFGIGAAVGVMVDFAISLVFMPTLLTLVKPDLAPPPQERWLMPPLQRMGRFAFAHPTVVAAAVIVAIVLAGVGISRLRVDTNHINFFHAEHPLSRSADVIDRQLSGIYSFNIFLEGPPDSLAEPEALRRMEQLSQELARLPFVRKVNSVVDYVKRVNQQLSDGSPEAHKLPDTKAAIAQELFVFGLTDEGRSDLSRVIASDYSRAQITIKLASMSSDLVFDQVQRAERLAADAFSGSPVRVTVTGSGRLFSTLDHYLVVSQLSSFGTAFVTVFAVIFVVFRSFRFGVLGIVANAVPVMVVLGIMGWFDISLNIATVMVASVALGIVDDDTIHFIARYRREVAAGAETLAAVELASMHEGRASLTTTIINTMAYAYLMTSAYRPTAWFGSLLAVTMVVAFLAEVIVVPATISLMPRIFGAWRPPAIRSRVAV